MQLLLQLLAVVETGLNIKIIVKLPSNVEERNRWWNGSWCSSDRSPKCRLL